MNEVTFEIYYVNKIHNNAHYIAFREAIEVLSSLLLPKHYIRHFKLEELESFDDKEDCDFSSHLSMSQESSGPPKVSGLYSNEKSNLLIQYRGILIASNSVAS